MKDFDTRLSRLEEIAEKLKDGAVPIDEASELFEEGVKMARRLDGELQKLERRVEILANQPVEPDETPTFELFPDLDHGESGSSETST